MTSDYFLFSRACGRRWARGLSLAYFLAAADELAAQPAFCHATPLRAVFGFDFRLSGRFRRFAFWHNSHIVPAKDARADFGRDKDERRFWPCKHVEESPPHTFTLGARA